MKYLLLFRCSIALYCFDHVLILFYHLHWVVSSLAILIFHFHIPGKISSLSIMRLLNDLIPCSVAYQVHGCYWMLSSSDQRFLFFMQLHQKVHLRCGFQYLLERHSNYLCRAAILGHMVIWCIRFWRILLPGYICCLFSWNILDCYVQQNEQHKIPDNACMDWVRDLEIARVALNDK